jgi:hypothetical protein
MAVAAAVLAIEESGELPAIHRQGEVTYLSGGIGDQEARAMKRVAGGYPLELEFLLKAMPRDEYLAGVKVSIKDDSDRTILDATASGPFLLAVLPEGRYTVTASNHGRTDRRAVHIERHEHRRVVFEWTR